MKEHFVKQSIRSRCSILGANGRLNLLVPKEKSATRVSIDEALIHNETDWRKLHWRSLEAAYRNSPYFEYYEDEIHPFFQTEHTALAATGISSIKLICELLELPFEPTFTSEYSLNFEGIDLRNAWNKQEYQALNPVVSYPNYIQVFADRHPFEPDLSILDLLFCMGLRSVEYLKGLETGL